MGIHFERRPIDRTELQISDEIALAGTLMEIGAVKRIVDRQMPNNCPVLDRVRDEYWACARGERRNAAVHLTPVTTM